MSTWKVVLALTIAAVAPVSGQRHGRIEVPPVTVEIPAVSVRLPAVSVHVPRVHVREEFVQVDIPAIRVALPEIPVAIPAINLDIPAFRIELPGFGNDTDRDVADLRRLQRAWREARREAGRTGDWSEADALARQLTRTAERLARQ